MALSRYLSKALLGNLRAVKVHKGRQVYPYATNAQLAEQVTTAKAGSIVKMRPPWQLPH